MIPVRRGKEPPGLKPKRESQLAKLRPLAAAGTLKSTHITGYNIAAKALWQAQHHKCCYCERIIECWIYDVEHYRPKAYATRTPGSSATHGYWWLAFTWRNLLFSCKSCNEKHKKSLFPLASSATLIAEQAANGKEKPLLLDPASNKINPVEHIVHVLQGTHWQPEPRNGSLLGLKTIEVCGLWRDELQAIRKSHVNTIVKKQADALTRCLSIARRADIEYEFQRACGLFEPELPFAALSYDALRYFVPDALLLAAIGQTWPDPAQVALP